MKSFRPAAGILAGILLAATAASALADQTFSSVKTAPVPSPKPTAAPGAVDVQFVILPARRRAHRRPRPAPPAPRPVPT